MTGLFFCLFGYSHMQSTPIPIFEDVETVFFCNVHSNFCRLRSMKKYQAKLGVYAFLLYYWNVSYDRGLFIIMSAKFFPKYSSAKLFRRSLTFLDISLVISFLTTTSRMLRREAERRWYGFLPYLYNIHRQTSSLAPLSYFFVIIW